MTTRRSHPSRHVGAASACQAMEALRELRDAASFELREVNIESDPELERRFMLEIPVIEVDGVVVTKAPVDLEAVREAVSTADRVDGRS